MISLGPVNRKVMKSEELRMSKSPMFMRVKRLGKRSTFHQVRILGMMFLMLWLVIGIVSPTLSDAWEYLGSRTPWGSSKLIPVRVSMNHLSSSQQQHIKDQPTLVAAHQVRPSLKLVGLGRQVIESESAESVFELGLLPGEADRLLKSDTVMQLRIQAPSLELLTQDLIHSPRGQKLRRSFENSQEKMLKAWGELLPALQKKLQAHLSLETVNQILSDPLIIRHIQEALMLEVGAKINMDEIGAYLGESEALANLGQLAIKHVDFWGVAGETVGGGWSATKRESHAIVDKVQDLWRRDVVIWDFGWCALKVAGAFTPYSSAKRAFDKLTRNASQLCSQIASSSKTVLKAAAKQGAKDLIKQGVESASQEIDGVLDESQKVAQGVWKTMKAPTLLEGFWTMLKHDEVLIKHIKVTYGEETLNRFMHALREMSDSMLVHKRVELLKTEVQQLASGGFKALVLDREGKGPNPLLLAVIQEQLSGGTRPVIHVIPGSRGRVNPGHLFMSTSASTQGGDQNSNRGIQR